MTIAGTYFGATQGSSTVTFSGVLATPTSWSDTSISEPVSAGATPGAVVVMENGVASNGAAFAAFASTGATGLPDSMGRVTVYDDQNLSGRNFIACENRA